MDRGQRRMLRTLRQLRAVAVTRTFDAAAKETALREEAHAWRAPSTGRHLSIASEEDIPRLDLSAPREQLVEDLRRACKEVGFYFITNHGIPDEVFKRGERAVHAMASLPQTTKAGYTMDTGKYPAGTGYLPVNNRKLPARKNPNAVEAFIVKRELGPRNVQLDDMPWPSELGKGWRDDVEAYANAMETLALRMLPVHSLALGESANFLDPAFKSALFRLRLSKYPAVQEYLEEHYGISPHVDTSFFTILHRVEQEPGLVVWSQRTEKWVLAPSLPGTLLVNCGEILRQVSNDTFLSARHYVINESSEDRMSLPFFFNATVDYKMAVAPGAGGGAPKYPPTSYLDGQGVVQGE